MQKLFDRLLLGSHVMPVLFARTANGVEAPLDLREKRDLKAMTHERLVRMISHRR